MGERIIPHFLELLQEATEGFLEVEYPHKIFCQTSIPQSFRKLAYPEMSTYHKWCCQNIEKKSKWKYCFLNGQTAIFFIKKYKSR